MASKTISLEKSAYELLREEKRPGESFSDVVNRVLGHKEPSFSDLLGALTPRTRSRVAEVLVDIREQDIEEETRRAARWGVKHGRHG
jgi:predicted CopG family antitoxin